MKFDFSGYVTRNDLKCADGRTIKHGAFKDNDGDKVPLVWQHLHDDPANILGHVLLENRADGVYGYASFNETEAGKNAKQFVRHKDVDKLSIYANKLVQNGSDVVHGVIREVSLVMAGANPGAYIDNISFQHGDTYTTSEEEAVIYTGLNISLDDLKHSDQKDENMATETNGETVQDIFDSLSDKQKQVVYYLMGEVTSAEHSDIVGEAIMHSDEEGTYVQYNIFEGAAPEKKAGPALSHDQIKSIFTDAARSGSLKDSFLAHAGTYGIDNIDYLFPDAKTITNSPDFISRRMEWVNGVINGTHHSPFSRIKSIAADITADEARARGFAKGNLKKEEVFGLLRRITGPTTIYKKQKLDRDDIVDITDLDVVAWLKAEMRVMLDEEIARAVLIGDGRDIDSEDKIDESCIRPIWKDADMYAHHVQIPAATTDVDAKIEAIIRSRTHYKGSGSPVLYTTESFLTDMLLLKDTQGRRIYETEASLASALRVSKIEAVEPMENATRVDGPNTLKLLGIIVNLKDYTIGADKGGNISMFDDFDIDYNRYKYLIEARMSGTLTHPKSALVIEQLVTP